MRRGFLSEFFIEKISHTDTWQFSLDLFLMFMCLKLGLFWLYILNKDDFEIYLSVFAGIQF